MENENKRFNLGNFDSVCEMLELLNTQRLIISDMEKENEELKEIVKQLQIDNTAQDMDGEEFNIDDGVKPYYVKDNVVQNKGCHASRVVCKSKEDAEICCAMLNLQSYWVNFYKKDRRHLIIERDNLKEENKILKKTIKRE